MSKRNLYRKLFPSTYHIFGDSHAEVFNYITEKKLIPDVKFKVTAVGGATAQGLRNPNSMTKALNEFEVKIDKISKKSKLIFLLGEVDTGFVIWYRAKKYNESIEKQLQESIFSYTLFVKKILDKGFFNVSMLSAPLPTIRDGQNWGDVANLRKEVTASQLDRTKLTIEYNNRLNAFCAKNKLTFINTDELLIDSSSGLIQERFLNSDKNNHHLDLDNYSKVLIKLFNEISKIHNN